MPFSPYSDPVSRGPVPKLTYEQIIALLNSRQNQPDEDTGSIWDEYAARRPYPTPNPESPFPFQAGNPPQDLSSYYTNYMPNAGAGTPDINDTYSDIQSRHPELYGAGGGAGGLERPSPDITGVAGGTSGGGGAGNALMRRMVRNMANVPQIDYQNIIDTNTQAINAAYAPAIKGLRGQNKATKREFGRTKGMIEGLTDQASKTLFKAANNAAQGGQATVENVKDQITAEAAGIDAGTVKQVKAVSKALTDIGAPEAAAGATTQILNQGGRTKKSIRNEGAVERRIASRSGNRQQAYLQNMAGGVELMGLDTIGDLAQQKAQILAANRQGIAGLKGERGKEIANTATTLNVREAEDQVAAENEVWDRFFNLLGYKEGRREFNLGRKDDLAMAALQAQSQANSSDSTGLPQGFLDAQMVAQTQFGSSEKQNAAINLLNSMRNNSSVIRGEHPLGGENSYGENTPFWFGHKLEKLAKKKYGTLFNKNDYPILYEMGRTYLNAQ